MYVPGDRLTSPEAAKVWKKTDESVDERRVVSLRRRADLQIVRFTARRDNTRID